MWKLFYTKFNVLSIFDVVCRCSCLNDQLVVLLQERGIGVINASAIGMGLLSNRGPASWHPATQDIKDACKLAAQYCQVRHYVTK